MNDTAARPTLRDLFGRLDFIDADAGRSVYSPAAYLADLLQLLHDELAAGDFNAFKSRRPDIPGVRANETTKAPATGVLLNGEQASTTQPLLAIVNEVMSRRVSALKQGTDAEAVLADADSPLLMPIDLRYERVRVLLRLLRATPRELYTRFLKRDDVDIDVIASERLGLSPSRRNKIVTASTGAELRELYGIPTPASGVHDAEAFKAIYNVDEFNAALGLDRAALRNLLFARLGSGARDDFGNSEQRAAGTLFPNFGLDGFVSLNGDESELAWVSNLQESATLIPVEWFDRVQRLLRLSRWSGIDGLDLELILRRLCGNELDGSALQRLAVLVDLRDRTGTPLDVLCGIFDEISGESALGSGDESATSASLFDRVFNGSEARLTKRYLPSGAHFQPEAFTGWTKFELGGDALSDDVDGSKEFRGRIRRALGISARDLSAVVTRFRDRATLRRRESILSQGLGPAGLSTLHRVTRLADLLQLDPPELLTLVDILEGDATLKGLDAFDVLQPGTTAATDLYAVLEARRIPDELIPAVVEGHAAEDHLTEDRFWLLQNLLAIGLWAKAAGLTPEDLSAAALGGDPLAADAKAELLQVSRGMLEAFQPTALSSHQLESEHISARSARVALSTIREPPRSLVAADPRVLTSNDTAAREAAHAVIAALGRVTVADFEDLQLGEALGAHLVTVLTRRGVLDAQGVLVPERLPARAGDLVVEPALSYDAGTIFDRLLELYSAALADGEAEEEIELELFPADLLTIGFTTAEADEVIDRLVFVGVLDATGHVVRPADFAAPENRQDFSITVGLDDFRNEIYSALAALQAIWLAAPLIVPANAWDALPLTESQRSDLEQNLIFNGHLETDRRITDRQATLGLTPATFDLALPFYRQRTAILGVLQSFVSDSRRAALGVTAEILRPVTDHIIASMAFAALADGQLSPGGRPTEELLATLADPAAQFELPSPITSAQADQVRKLLAEIVADADKCRLTDAALALIQIDGEHATIVRQQLQAVGILGPDGFIPAAQVESLSKVSAGIDFAVPAYADFSKDIFFLLHDVSVEVSARVNELAASIASAAAAQDGAVSGALAEFLQLSAAASAAVLDPMIRPGISRTAALIGPVLAAAGTRDELDTAPADRIFQTTLRRASQFASYARKLGMSAREIQVAFGDQELGDKFPEPIQLPPEIDQIDALWTGPDQKVYLFRKTQFWTFDAGTLQPVDSQQPLAVLSPEFAALPEVDAVYTTATGDWLLAAGRAWRRLPGSDHWASVERPLGKVTSRFDDPERIDGALVDSEGRICLFARDQYVRYSNLPQDFVDEGYPRRISPEWPEELGLKPLPPCFSDGIDAAVTRKDDPVWLFKGDQFVSSEAPESERPIVDFWGRVRHDLASAQRVDAVFDLDGRCAITSGDQLTTFDNSIENAGLCADEGSPRSLSAVFPGLPEDFRHGLDAAITVGDTRHLFRNQHCATRPLSGSAQDWVESATAQSRFARVRNTLQETGRVDAAFAGLDGRIYLFSGNQYVRSSGADPGRADEGYPRTISLDWGGLDRVDAACTLDGKTYLFGSVDGVGFYIRYSTRDYKTPDADYPKPTLDNFWNLPQALVEKGFHTPDCVFSAPDGRTHLFNGGLVVTSDHNHRWWSEPQKIEDLWSSLPFKSVSAAFTARDGRAYLFSSEDDPRFARYSDAGMQRLDDRFPKRVAEYWGKVVNNLAQTGRVDAALTIPVSAASTDPVHYLFSGDQFYRYSGEKFDAADEGYPKRIQNSLVLEPPFVNLKAPAERGIDGVWADSGNVFVFISDQIHIASTDRIRTLASLGVASPRAADIEDGRLAIRGAGGWMHVRPPEAFQPASSAVKPRALRGAPPSFQDSLTAILRGLDGNTYLFAAETCFDTALEHEYPTGSAWGYVRNTIADQSQVDAALMGRDGRFYLFAGPEFISYTPADDSPLVIPAFADGLPAAIADRWGGLQNVRYAFVRDGKTYLFEARDEDGRMRYVRYSGDDYSRPDAPAPMECDFSYWKIPSEFVTAGFDRVDAVLAEGDRDLLLVREHEFVHYDGTTKRWTSPRPLAVRWPGLPPWGPDFETIRALANGPDGRTLLFADSTWLLHDGTAPSKIGPISQRWGRLDNRIAVSNRVDAAVVAGDHTYLFSGDQYVRYTGVDYRHVDAGYPKTIRGELRKEPAFQDLPNSVEDAFEGLKPEDVWIETAFVSGGVLYAQAAGQAFAISANLSRSMPLRQIGRLRNELVWRAKVDAAFSVDEKLFLLSGDQYVRYSDTSVETVDDGYPRPTGTDLLQELAAAAPPLPAGFDYALDAAVYVHGLLYLFKDKQFVKCDLAHPDSPLEAAPVRKVFGHAQNAFLPTAEVPAPRVDAAFVAPDGALYVFKGEQMLRYADPDAATVDEKFPCSIREHLGGLPPKFQKGIDAGFRIDGRLYLGRGTEYVRYSDPAYQRIDAIYPQSFTTRFRSGNDFLLADLKTIQQYIKLCRAHPSDDAGLTDFMLRAPREKADPYGLLAALYDWEISDLAWLKRFDGFLGRPGREASSEVIFDLELVLRIHGTMEFARLLGSHPEELFKKVWAPLYGISRQTAPAIAALERFLNVLYAGDNWEKIERQLTDQDNTSKRDALTAWLVAHDTQLRELPDAKRPSAAVPNPRQAVRGLSNRLLTDVEMDASADSSTIVEAIAAAQLFVHRALQGLEEVDFGVPANREQFRQRWHWLKNYRVWEANRKVFVYPESFIRPELRASRTPAFESLRNELLQGQMDDASVTDAFRKYVDEFARVSTLAIVGGYVRSPGQDATLILFGRMRHDPHQYYYRTALFPAGSTVTAHWQAWVPMGVDIPAERVYPVFAFGRIFVFWHELERQSDPNAAVSLEHKTSNGTDVVSSSAQSTTRIRIRYSFQNLNGDWAPPQEVKTDEKFALKSAEGIEDVKLAVGFSADAAAPSQDFVHITCTYRDLKNKVLLEQARKQLEEVNNALLQFTSTLLQGPWILLPVLLEAAHAAFRKAAQPLVDKVSAAQAKVDEMEKLNTHVVASFAVAGDGSAQLLITDAVAVRDPGLAQLVAPAGQPAVPIDTDSDEMVGPWFAVDAESGSYLCKPAETTLDESKAAQSLAGNTERFPEWDGVDAAFAGADGDYHFFRGMRYAHRGQDKSLAEMPIIDRWGRTHNAIANEGLVDAAWVTDGKRFLAHGADCLVFPKGAQFAESRIDLEAATNIAAFNDGIDAVLAEPSGPRKIGFRGSKYIDTSSPESQLDIRERWGLRKNGFNDPNQPESVVGALTHGDRTFIIGAKSYLRYTGADYSVCDAGYPRPQTLRALLNELASGAADGHPETDLDQPVLAAFSRGTDKWLLSVQNATYSTPRGAGRKAQKADGPAPGLEVALQRGKLTFGPDSVRLTSGNEVPTPHTVSAAFAGADSKLYIFFGSRQAILDVRPLDAEAVQTAFSTLSDVGANWGVEPNAFTAIGSHVDAAFTRGSQIFLISGNEYIRYSSLDQHFVDAGYPKPFAERAADDLPSLEAIDAALFDGDGPGVFFGHVATANGGSEGRFMRAGSAIVGPIAPRWGLVRNSIVENGLDGAWKQDNSAVYLFSGDEYARYKIERGEVALFMDAGYPKKFADVIPGSEFARQPALLWGSNGGWTTDGITYLFRGRKYSRFGVGATLDEQTILKFKDLSLRGSWHNLPKIFNQGIDAALSDSTRLVLFAGGKFVDYKLTADSPRPVESANPHYDLVRLTASTASTLTRTLFAGGVESLLKLETQLTDETPVFIQSDGSTTPPKGTIQCLGRTRVIPSSGHLDFASANGIYYQEIFFHAPFLIASTLQESQRFEEARTWHERVFDPATPENVWRYLPFVATDTDQIVTRLQRGIAILGLTESSVNDLFNTAAGPLRRLNAAFQGERDLSADEKLLLVTISGQADRAITDLARTDAPLLTQAAAAGGGAGQVQSSGADVRRTAAQTAARSDLSETLGLIKELPDRWREIESARPALIQAYLDDPFDPHAIAALRPVAYRKALVMRYIDNLLDWGDMLFGQFTRESINEARMLYVQASNVLGERPESLGRQQLSDDQPYDGLASDSRDYDFLFELADPAGSRPLSVARTETIGPDGKVVREPYFFIPPNDELTTRWTRVEDRLFKIRHGLNLEGQKQSLALFEPPIDPMALVNAVAGGASLADAVALGAAVEIPHYRFSVMIERARELAERVSQLGNDLLLALEKRDSEELARLQTSNEAEILDLTVKLHEQELAEAIANRNGLAESKTAAEARKDTYDRWLTQDFLVEEILQMELLGFAGAFQGAAAILQLTRGFSAFIPAPLLGPFIIGTQETNPATPIEGFAEASNGAATTLQTTGEILGLVAQHQRSVNEWQLQKDLAVIDIRQIEQQLTAADRHIDLVTQQLAIVRKQIEQNKSVSLFYRNKFSTKELYEWMAGRIATMHFQAFQLALGVARAAERAFQFERGRPERVTTFIQGQYWDNRRKGLTAGAALALDIERMDQAYLSTDRRRFEIKRVISLLQLDPRAFLDFKANGVCEFELTEALFDYDFPGHYCRQVKTIAVDLGLGDGIFANATVTQLTNRVVIEPDLKAVAFLLDPKETPPLSLRQNWKASQQIVLSQPDAGEDNNGMFSARFDTERYYPFEGTGAVSRWRLELGGPLGAFDLRGLTDVTVALKYTALAGGDAFAPAVRGLLKPIDTIRAFSLSADFEEQWSAFLAGDDTSLELPLRPALFRNISGGRINAIFARYQTETPGSATFVLDLGDPVPLPDGKTVDTSGLTVRGTGTTLRLEVKGDKSTLTNAYLLMSYKAAVN